MKKLYLITVFLFLAKFVAVAQIEDRKIEETQEKNRAKIIVYIKTGEIYKGYFISQNKDFLEIETESAGILKIPTQRIKNIESFEGSKEHQTENPDQGGLQQINAVRYMLGTSAFNYEKGVNYIRNNPITFHKGLSDNFSVGIGTSVWAFVLGVANIYINPQYTGQLGENVRYKIGLDAFAGAGVRSESGAAAILNTGITLGNPDLNLTGTVYYGAISDFEGLRPFYSLAGMARISKKLMVVSEGFYVPTRFDGNVTFGFYGLRYIVKSASYDFGFLNSPETAEFIPFGIPFVAITVKI